MRREHKIAGPFDPETTTRILREHGFKFDSTTCPIKLSGQHVSVHNRDQSVTWHQWDEVPARDLTTDEQDLLRWLGEAQYSQYGECHGAALDVLVGMGYAQVHRQHEHQVFIAVGTGIMFHAVSLTNRGKETLQQLGGREP